MKQVPNCIEGWFLEKPLFVCLCLIQSINDRIVKSYQSEIKVLKSARHGFFWQVGCP